MEIISAKNKRLAYYAEPPDETYWDRHWDKHFNSKRYLRAEQGFLGRYEKPFTRYLPQTGYILEAGCGFGDIVLALRSRGYQCEGIEFAPKTVDRVKSLRPDIPIRTGDATCIDVPDGYYNGYVSLGVVEHRVQGPEIFLQEAYRILAAGGTAYISVPCVNVLRNTKVFFGWYGKTASDRLDFYQYAFTKKEMCGILKNAGFSVIAVHYYDVWKGLKDEIGFLRLLRKQKHIGPRLENTVRRMEFLGSWCAHMAGFIVQKP